MSSQIRCPICKRLPQEPINLRCEHHPCYQCSQSLIAVESQSKIEQKYRIICPACTQKTVFYDLRHLIIDNHRGNQEQYFVTDRFLSKPEVKVHHYQNNNYLSSESNSQPITRRGSIQSIANSNNKAMLEVKCLEHGQPYKYFCCDCSEKPAKNALLCCECAKPHYNNSHRLLSLRQSETKILRMNMDSKDEMTSWRSEINYILEKLNHNKSVVEDYFVKIEENLGIEFNSLLAILQTKYKTLSQALRAKYEQSIQQIDTKIEKLMGQQKILESLKEIDLKDLETNLKFYQTYQKFTISNQLANFSAEIELSKLPKLYKQFDFSHQLSEDWIQIKSCDRDRDGQHSSQKRIRKPSNAEEQYSYRSTKDKENNRIGLSPSQLKVNQRKIVC